MGDKSVNLGSGEGIKIILHDRVAEGNNNLMQTADSYEVPAGTVMLFGHGNSSNIFDDRAGKGANTTPLTARETAKLILDHGGKQTDIVILHSCSTGKGDQSFARELSFYFAKVIAPTREILPQGKNATESEYVDQIYGNNPDSTTNYNDPGRMKEFYPEDRIAYLMNPKLVDSPESERPSPQWDKHPIKHKVWENVGQMPSTNRDAGDEEPFEKDISKRASIIPLDYFPKMKETYQSVVNPENKESFEAHKTKAINNYPELKLVFLVRDKALASMGENKSAIAIAGIDGHIANSVENGSIYGLSRSFNVKQAEIEPGKVHMAEPVQSR